MKHEITCPNNACASVVDLTGWGQAGRFHRHVQLVEHAARGECPVCGQRGTTVRRDVPSAHLFALGQIVATPGAQAALSNMENPPKEIIEREIKMLVDRHARGDWGLTVPEDVKVNRGALVVGEDGCGGVLMSIYEVRGKRIWVKTEAGRHLTTVLLPEEY